MPPTDSADIALALHELEDSDDVIEAYTERWAEIRTFYKNRYLTKGWKQKIYQIRIHDPSAKYLCDILRLVHAEQRTVYRYNVSFGQLLRNSETNGLRLFYQSHNTRYHDAAIQISSAQELETQLKNYTTDDILESAALQRPNSKWRFEHIVGFTVTLQPIPTLVLG